MLDHAKRHPVAVLTALLVLNFVTAVLAALYR